MRQLAAKEGSTLQELQQLQEYQEHKQTAEATARTVQEREYKRVASPAWM
jgi:hypothetical protein